MIAKLSQVKQGLLHDLLTRGIDGNGELRRPVEEARELYRETELGWVPRGWGVSVVGAECQIHNNLRKPIASDIRERMQGEYPYYGPTGVLDHINEYRVDGKFVLIGEDGDHFLKFSTWAMTQLVSGRFNVSNHAHILSGIGNLSTEWVHYYFRHRDVTLFTTRQGAGRFKLNQASLRKLPLPIPPPAEQEGIIARMVALEGREEGERHQRAKLRTLKQGLMDDLLTGRVRVK